MNIWFKSVFKSTALCFNLTGVQFLSILIKGRCKNGRGGGFVWKVFCDIFPHFYRYNSEYNLLFLRRYQNQPCFAKFKIQTYSQIFK